MNSEIVVEISEGLSKAVDDWANYLSISREELITDAVESYLRGKDKPTLIAEVRETYTAIKPDDLAMAEAYIPVINESLSNERSKYVSPMTATPLPRLQVLPKTLPLDIVVRLELEEGLPVFRAPAAVQECIEKLLEKQQDAGLSADEDQELDLYEEVNDYISFVNRTVRDRLIVQSR